MVLNAWDFWMTSKDLEGCKRRVPIFSIFWQLTDEQLVKVDDNGFIKAELLTREQLAQVEEALMFDYHFAKIHNETASEVHKCL